jgi:hypothetical protein
MIERYGAEDPVIPRAAPVSNYRNSYEEDFIFALAASQSAWVAVMVKPWPLQEFWPLQLFFADLHDDMPLQELAPVHFTLPSSAAAALNETAENMIAAAAASAMLPVLRVFIERFLRFV